MICRDLPLLFLSPAWPVLGCVARVGARFGAPLFLHHSPEEFRRIVPVSGLARVGPRWPAWKTVIIFVARVTICCSPEEFSRIVPVSGLARVARVEKTRCEGWPASLFIIRPKNLAELSLWHTLARVARVAHVGGPRHFSSFARRIWPNCSGGPRGPRGPRKFGVTPPPLCAHFDFCDEFWPKNEVRGVIRKMCFGASSTNPRGVL